MTADYRQYLRPDVIAQISRLDLVARLVVEGFITGLHRSPYHGFSVEFAEYRPYNSGESIKNIDWKVFGRTERYYVKQFEEETNLKSWLLLDVSGSMGYTSHSVTKMQYGSYLSAALAYLMIQQRDAIGLVTFDEKIQSYFPPRSIHSYLHVLLNGLTRLDPGAETHVSQTFHELAERIQRRGLIIIFSDLMDDPQSIVNALKHFRHKKHEVIVFHLLDPQEQNFDFKQDTLFVDMETGENLEAPAEHIRAEYLKQMRSFQNYFKTQCLQNRIDYVPVNTAESFDKVLLSYLAKRQKIGG